MQYTRNVTATIGKTNKDTAALVPKRLKASFNKYMLIAVVIISCIQILTKTDGEIILLFSSCQEKKYFSFYLGLG